MTAAEARKAKATGTVGFSAAPRPRLLKACDDVRMSPADKSILSGKSEMISYSDQSREGRRPPSACDRVRDGAPLGSHERRVVRDGAYGKSLGSFPIPRWGGAPRERISRGYLQNRNRRFTFVRGPGLRTALPKSEDRPDDVETLTALVYVVLDRLSKVEETVALLALSAGIDTRRRR
jgi:hypothetical protein